MLLVYGVCRRILNCDRTLTNLGVKYGKFGRHIWDINVLEAASRNLLVVSRLHTERNQVLDRFLPIIAVLSRQRSYTADYAIYEGDFLHNVP